MTPEEILAGLKSLGVDGKLLRMCDVQRVTLNDVLGRKRYPEVVEVRHGFWRWLHAHMGFSLSRIARVWGVDHTTVMNAVHKEET